MDGGDRLIQHRSDYVFAGVGILVHRRWAESISKIRRQSDRVISLDLQIGYYKYRVLSVYLPHAGFPREDFLTTIDEIRYIILDAQQNGIRCLIGGDFNTDIRFGWRADLLNEVLSELGLCITNYNEELSFEDQWTFQSCLGTRRIIDYCIVSDDISFRTGSAINDLDLHSDHRAGNASHKFSITESK